MSLTIISLLEKETFHSERGLCHSPLRQTVPIGHLVQLLLQSANEISILFGFKMVTNYDNLNQPGCINIVYTLCSGFSNDLLAVSQSSALLQCL